METGRVLTRMLVVMACCLVTSVANRASSSLQEEDSPGSFYSQDVDMERGASQEDISKLLLKHLRFRQLPESGLPVTSSEFVPSAGQSKVHKRKEQRRLVNNLAALLSGLRDRQSESSMRMPSLRFGK
ncbi:uncharacterized protein LOC143289487 [Babylonia areolata]|uniref:uncharacterized protein LOC143289487 n=1 Tax=Babylonia areolata TaxID=304850 RepID=UPI003FD10D7E